MLITINRFGRSVFCITVNQNIMQPQIKDIWYWCFFCLFYSKFSGCKRVISPKRKLYFLNCAKWYLGVAGNTGLHTMPITPPLRGDREEQVAWELPERWVLEVTCTDIKIWNMSLCSGGGFHGHWWYVEDDDCFQTPARREVERLLGGGGLGEVRRTPQNSGEAMGVWRREADPALQRISWDLPDTWKWGRDTGEFQTGVNLLGNQETMF